MADKDGNVYVGGYFGKSASFGSVTLESPATGGFVAKLDADGSVVWAVAIPSTDVADVRGIAIGQDGNVYLAGNFSGMATFGETVLSTGGSDAFVTSLDAEGVFRWALATGTDAYASALGLAMDELGGVYVTGYFAGKGALGAAPLVAIKEDAFVAKLDAQGAVLWVTTAGGNGLTQAHSIAARPNGETVVAGSFYGLPGAMVQAGDFKITSQGSNDVLVLFLDPDGKVENARSFGGPNWEDVWAVTLDTAGDAYVAGLFSESSTFDSTVLTSEGYGLFLAALSPSGDLAWVASGGGPAEAAAVSVLADESGNVFFTGLFSGKTSFGDTMLTSAGLWDLYIARVGPGGVLDGAIQAGGKSNDYGTALAVAPSGDILLTGFFEGSAGLGAITVNASGGFDSFVWKLPASF